MPARMNHQRSSGWACCAAPAATSCSKARPTGSRCAPAARVAAASRGTILNPPVPWGFPVTAIGADVVLELSDGRRWNACCSTTAAGWSPGALFLPEISPPHFLHIASARLTQVLRSRRYEESGIRPSRARHGDGRVLLLPGPDRAPEPVVTTQPFSRGDIVDAVSATGTLEAVETVEVGTQVSGVVRELYADFNSIVRKGQVIARLDPQPIQTQIEQQSANVLQRRGRPRTAEGLAGRCGAEAGAGEAADRAQPDSPHRARNGGRQRPGGARHRSSPRRPA